MRKFEFETLISYFKIHHSILLVYHHMFAIFSSPRPFQLDTAGCAEPEFPDKSNKILHPYHETLDFAIEEKLLIDTDRSLYKAEEALSKVEKLCAIFACRSYTSTCVVCA